MTQRRQLLAAVAAATGWFTATPAALAQAATPFRLSWLGPGMPAEELPLFDALRHSLRDLGYVEGRNLVIDARSSEHSAALLETHVAAVVAAAPQVIVALGPPAVALRRTTRTIPVVFSYSGDPVLAGLVESYARPGGNCTGISYLQLDLVGKRIELLKALMPGLKRIAVVAVPQHPGDPAERRASEAAAKAAGLEIEYFPYAGTPRLEQTLEAIRSSRHEAALMFPVQSITSNSARIAAWSIKHRIATVSGWSRFAEEGNLMSYGANMPESYRRVASFVDRILKGAKPADLPVEIPQHFELTLNLKTARALGITVPQSVLLRAEHVIE